MQHPRTRAERRHARETWRNHRRKIIAIYLSGSFSGKTKDPTRNRGWNRGGKQYTACGNRCGHCIYTRIDQRKQLKRARRKINPESHSLPLPLPFPSTNQPARVPHPEGT